MIAFCIIIGDTIPHVLSALIPSLSTIPVLSLLADRRAVIVIFVLGISYPLSLYRDIAKVRVAALPLIQSEADRRQLAKASTLALISMLVILMTVVIQGFRTPGSSRGDLHGILFINSGVFQAIGVISFGEFSWSLASMDPADKTSVAFVCRWSPPFLT